MDFANSIRGPTLLRWIAFSLAAVVLAIAGLAGYLFSADLGRHKEQITTLVSDALGREVRVDGGLSLRLGRTVTLRAEGVSIANPAWAVEPALVRADGVEADIDFWSLVRGPVQIESLAVRGVLISLQESDDGRRNWARSSTETASADDGGDRFRPPSIRAVEASDVRISLASPGLTAVNEVVVDSAYYAVSGALVSANASGEINGHALAIDSTIVPVEQSWSAGAVSIDADVRMGEVTMKAGLRLDDTQTLAVSSAEIQLDGPDIDYVFGILNLPKITSGPLALRASVAPDPRRSGFDAEGQLGEYHVSAKGWLEDIGGAGGFDMSVRLAGPSLAALGRPFHIANLPAAAFDVETNLRSRTDGIEFDDTRIRVSDASASGQGAVVWLPDGGRKLDVSAAYRGMTATIQAHLPPGFPAGDLDFEVDIDGEDAVDVAGHLGLEQLGGRPFVLSARGTYGGRTVSLSDASLGVGQQKLAVTGRAGFVNDTPDVDLRFDADNVDLSPWLAGSALLDAGPRTVAGTGRLKVSVGRLEATELALRSGDVSLRGRVILPLANATKAAEFALQLKAGAIASLAPGLAPPAFERKPIEVSASGRFRGRSVLLSEARIGLGEQRLALSGRAELIDAAPDLAVRFDATNIDLSPWLSGRDVLAPRLRTIEGTGRLRVSRGRLDADELLLRSGDVVIEGRVSLPLADKGRRGRFALHLQAPGVGHLVPGVADGAFGGLPVDVRGNANWTPDRWQLDELLWRIPERGDVTGNIVYAAGPAPALSARLHAASLDLRPQRKVAPIPSSAAGRDTVIPARKIEIPRLPDLDIGLSLQIDSLQSAVTAGASFMMEARLAGGRLVVDRLETNGKRGQVSAAFTVETNPAAPLEAKLELSGRGLYIAAPDEPAATLSARPRFDLEATLGAKGADLRELAKTLTGRLMVQAEEGTITRRGGALVTLVMDDFLTRTLETINPLIKEREQVQLNCFVVLADIQNGTIRGAPLVALQTTEVNLFTRGAIDLGSETLTLDIVTRPRRGFGFGLGDIINPFTRIGGTLAAPRLVPDPKSAVLETGAGIATGGAWVVAKKLRDRFFTGNPCAKALEQRVEANERQ